VPAAAVIPAPRVYIKVVAVKKLVVGLWVRGQRSSTVYCRDQGRAHLILFSKRTAERLFRRVYFE
jgi:hypothetical protein